MALIRLHPCTDVIPAFSPSMVAKAYFDISTIGDHDFRSAIRKNRGVSPITQRALMVGEHILTPASL